MAVTQLINMSVSNVLGIIDNVININKFGVSFQDVIDFFTQGDNFKSIKSKESFTITIDSDDNDTNRVFEVRSNAGSNEKIVMKVGETGDLDVLNRVLVGANSNISTGLELGNSNSSGTNGYMDFHYGNNSSEDYNIRLLNNNDGELFVASALGALWSFSNFGNYTNKHILPSANNTYSLGNSTNKFTDVWATNGTIQTSDENEKENIENSKLGLDFILNLKPVCYKFKDIPEQIKKEKRYSKQKNEDGIIDLVCEEVDITLPEKKFTRTHYGFLNQDIEKLLEEKNIDTKDFAGFIKDKETGERALRYIEFIPILVKAIQDQNEIIQILKDKLGI
jgi:hypothetical protein